MSVRFLTSRNRLVSLSGYSWLRYNATQSLYRVRRKEYAIAALPLVSHRLKSTHSHKHNCYLGDDPIYPYLVDTPKLVPLTKLAMQLPDEVIEQLDGGLKKHLQRFPSRYRVLNDSRGVLHVKFIRPPPLRSVPPMKVKHEFGYVLKNRFMPLDNLKAHASKLDVGASLDLKSEGEVNREAAGKLLMDHILRSLDDPHSGVTLWRLFEEYKSDESEGATTSADTTLPQSRTLHAFRWECIRGSAQIQNALVEPAEGPMFTRRLYIYVCDNQYISSKGFDGDNENDADKETLLDCIEDYNFYRLCRVLSTKTFMPLHEVQRTGGDLVTQPLAAVLAIGAAERRLRGRTTLLFCNDTDDTNDFHSYSANTNDDTSLRAVAVRFHLDEARELPNPYLTMTAAEITAELEEIEKEFPRKKRSAAPNHLRVRHVRRSRALQRSLALHELGTTPLCNLDVLAYYVFDILPPSGELVQTGLLPLLLPEDVRSRTDARSVSWIESYPHLFRLVERAPHMFLQRTDAPEVRDTLTTKMESKELVSANEEEAQQRQGQQPQCGAMLSLSEERALQDPEEQLRFVISLVAARLDVKRGRPVLPSHLPKFMNKKLRQIILAPFRKGGTSRILAFLEKHPDVFVLTYGINPHEPVVTLKPYLDPKFIHETTESPTADNISSNHKGEDKKGDT